MKEKEVSELAINSSPLSESENNNESFWRLKLAGFIAPTPLVVDIGVNILTGLKSEYLTEQADLTAEETGNLVTLARQNNLALATMIQGVWALLLHRYSGEAEVLFGITVKNEISTGLPLRVEVNADQSVMPWLGQLQSRISELTDYAHIPLERIRAWSEIPHGQPLFESICIVENAETGNGFENEQVPGNAAGACPVILLVRPGAELSLHLRYNKTRFSADSITRLLGHFKTLLTSIIQQPEQTLSQVKMLTDVEQRQILLDWNDTSIDFPEDACLHELFEQNAAQHTNKVAMIFKGEELTYGQLNSRANQIAHYLQKSGVGPDVLVGVLMERSLEMIACIVAIAKAGGAYVPLDPNYPQARISFMVEDTKVAVLLTQQSLVEQLPEVATKVFVYEEIKDAIAAESENNPHSCVTPEHLAYVIFTSGSTGRPKGAVLNHRGRVNNFCDFNRRCKICPDDRLLGLASLSFDMSAYDIYGTLAAGGTNVIVEGPAVLEPGRWAELMLENDVTVWHSVPALLEMLVNYLSERPEKTPKSLRLVLLGGDWIPVNLPDRLKALIPGVFVVSMGGATECSMDSTIYDIEETSVDWKSIPYGVPMANQLSYVLDQHLNPQPVGVPGELYLGGIGVGRGYFNRPALTAEKFIPNPFNQVPGDRMYRTGDLARYRSDGNLELLGRIDFQVKIRGYRVELGEITSTLVSFSGVKEAVVIAKEERPAEELAKRNKRLVAYVVPQPETEESETAQKDEYQNSHVAQWQMVYEEMYGQTDSAEDLTFNTIGWNSSYTGLPISGDEMREWVAQSVERILALKPKRVLEIACGNGLLLFRVAPYCEKYLGIDFSSVALAQVQNQLSRPGKEMPQVELSRRMADDFTGIKANSYDSAIINSVVQLFPGIEYFVKVMAGIIETVQPGGHIYVGDVISLPHLEAFHTSIQLFQAPASLSLSGFRQRVGKQISQEEQLFIDPAFFFALKHEFPKVSAVEIRLRRGKHKNEMTKFRYDVVLHIGGESTSIDFESWNWQAKKLTLKDVHGFLNESQPEMLRITEIPNTRLAEEIRALELLEQLPGDETVGSLRQKLSAVNETAGVDPEAIWAMGAELPYSITIDWSASGNIGCFDVLFRRVSSNGSMEEIALPTLDSATNARPKPWRHYANNPLQGMQARKLVPKLRTYMQQQLPDYMVPTDFVLLDALPLSPNGKIDRQALPSPDHTRPALAQNYIAPRNFLEEVVANIWAEVFEFEQIGIYDNFLEIGGHSLIATQIMVRLQDLFPVELPLRYLFGSPTIAELSEQIDHAGQDVGVNVNEVARTVIELGKLSDEEVSAMLATEEKK